MSNTPINIAKNGTTTLATAGKYCDRNIDVNVEVPSYEAELEEQKAIMASILDRSITAFTSDTLTAIETYAFGYCRSLHTLDCPNVTSVRGYAFRYCEALHRVDFPSLSNISNNAFNGSAIDTLIIRYDGICQLGHINAFADTPIANGTGYVYVPDNLVDSYKTATNWATYASQIKPISELEE